MKKQLLIIVLCILSAALRAQESSVSDIVAAIARDGGSIESLECDFVQTRHSALLSGDIRSEGRMCYAKPDMLSWEYTAPTKFSFVMEGARVSMRDAQGTEIANAGARKVFREIARLMMGNLTGKMLSDDKSFSADAAEKDGIWIVTLTPVRKDLQQMLSGMTIHYDIKNKSVVRVEMKEKNGDCTTIEFKNIRYGTAG